MSQLSKNLTLACFLLLVLSFRGVIAGECRLREPILSDEKVFCSVRMELWFGGTAGISINTVKDIQSSAISPADYPEELTRPLNSVLWLPIHQQSYVN